MAATFVEAVTELTVEVEPAGVTVEDPPGYLADLTGLDASMRDRTAGSRRGVPGVEAKLNDEVPVRARPERPEAG